MTSVTDICCVNASVFCCRIWWLFDSCFGHEMCTRTLIMHVIYVFESITDWHPVTHGKPSAHESCSVLNKFLFSVLLLSGRTGWYVMSLDCGMVSVGGPVVSLLVRRRVIRIIITPQSLHVRLPPPDPLPHPLNAPLPPLTYKICFHSRFGWTHSSNVSLCNCISCTKFLV